MLNLWVVVVSLLAFVFGAAIFTWGGVAVFKDMSAKLVNTITALSGQDLGRDALNHFANTTIDQDGARVNGPTFPNGQHRTPPPSGWPADRTAAEAR